MTNANDITELRSHLFDTLRDLRSGKIDVKVAKAVNETAAQLIHSAAVEVEMLKHVGGCGTGFIRQQAPGLPPARPGLAGQLGVNDEE